MKTKENITIANIKLGHQNAGLYFFKPDTLRFHKDKVNNWMVVTVGDLVFIRNRATGQVRQVQSNYRINTASDELFGLSPAEVKAFVSGNIQNYNELENVWARYQNGDLVL